MQRAERVANEFIADEDLSRGAADMARAVDSVDVSYVAVAPVLAGLVAHGSMAADVLADNIAMTGEQLGDALPRLQDLGLITVSLVEGSQLVSLTEGGSLAAQHIGT